MFITYNELQNHVKAALDKHGKRRKDTLREIKFSKTGIEAYDKAFAYADEISNTTAAVLFSSVRCAGFESAAVREDVCRLVLMPMILASAQWVGEAADTAQVRFNGEIGLGVAPAKRRTLDVMMKGTLLKIWPVEERMLDEDNMKDTLRECFAEIVRGTMTANRDLHKSIGATK